MQRINFFADPRAALGQFRAQRRHAFAFLHAQPAQIREARGAILQGRQRDGGHDAVAQIRLTRHLARRR